MRRHVVWKLFNNSPYMRTSGSFIRRLTPTGSSGSCVGHPSVRTLPTLGLLFFCEAEGNIFLQNHTKRYHVPEDSNPQYPLFAVDETLEYCDLPLTDAGPRC
jgi:hypothetical protein